MNVGKPTPVQQCGRVFKNHSQLKYVHDAAQSIVIVNVCRTTVPLTTARMCREIKPQSPSTRQLHSTNTICATRRAWAHTHTTARDTYDMAVCNGREGYRLAECERTAVQGGKHESS